MSLIALDARIASALGNGARGLPSHEPGITLINNLPIIFFQNQAMFQPN